MGTKKSSETGWFYYSGFSSDDHNEKRSVTHTIAYTLWGYFIWLRFLIEQMELLLLKKLPKELQNFNSDIIYYQGFKL